MSDITKEALELLLGTGRGQQVINDNPLGDPFFVTPGGEPKGLNGFYAPRRIERTVTLQDANSFVDYVKLFKTERTLIFAKLDTTSATLTAILDYHGKAEPDYCRHKAVFTTLETPEWAAWRAADRKPMTQVEFATWIEDNVQLFVGGVGNGDDSAPTGAELLELVRSLHGHQNARFSTALRLDNGAYSASYEEDVEVKGSTATRGGAIELPKTIMGGFAIFQGGDAYGVTARLKSRVNERRLMLHFETVNVPHLVRENIMAVVRLVGEKTGIIPLLGAA